MNNYVNKTSKLISCGAMVACFMAQGCGYHEGINYGDTPSKPTTEEEEKPNYTNLARSSSAAHSTTNRAEVRESSMPNNRESEKLQPTIRVNGKSQKIDGDNSPSRVSTKSKRGSTAPKSSESGGFFGCFGSSKKTEELEKHEDSPETNPGPKVE